MGRGYAEGPAVEAAEEAREARPAAGPRVTRRAIQGCTREQPERHFLGWADEVDADALFRAGAWGLQTVELTT